MGYGRPINECEACSVGLYATCGRFSLCYHTHPQVLVRYPLDYDKADRGRDQYLEPPTAPKGTIGVDRDVLPLLRLLWDAEVRTWVSCQGGGERPDGGEYSGYVSYHADDHAAALTVALDIWSESDLNVTVKPITTGLPLTGRIGFPRFPSKVP